MMKREISIEELTNKALSKALELGLDVRRGGSIILNEKQVFHVLSRALEEYGVVYTSIKDGLERYPDIVDKYGKTLKNIDPKTIDNGILLYIPRGIRIKDPIYTCLVLGTQGFVQRIYDLYVIEDGASAIASKGCLSLVNEGAHVGITDIHLGSNASLYSVMVHNWLPSVTVSSITRIWLGPNSNVHNYYVNLTGAKRINYGTEVFLDGPRAKFRSDTIVLGRRSDNLSYWVNAYLHAHETKAELISRVIGRDSTRVVMRSKIVSKAPRTQGHIECQGLQLSDSAVLSTIPVLESHVSQTMLTHEASIGKISRDELEYLLSRGFTEEEAVSMIVRGFVETGLEVLPDKLRPLVESVLDELSRASM